MYDPKYLKTCDIHILLFLGKQFVKYVAIPCGACAKKVAITGRNFANYVTTLSRKCAKCGIIPDNKCAKSLRTTTLKCARHVLDRR